METRGPEGSGTWLSVDRHVPLALRWLAIIGLGSQVAEPTKEGFASAPTRPLPVEVRTRRKTRFTVRMRSWLEPLQDDVAAWRRLPSFCDDRSSWGRHWAVAVASQYSLL